MDRAIALYTWLCLLGFLGMGQVLWAQESDPLEAIRLAEERSGGRIGLEVIRCRDWQAIYCHREDELMVPASLVKLLSTGAALRSRGRSYRFPTYVYIDGSIRAGTLEGDLVVYGGGDPSLGSAYMAEDSTRLLEELVARLEQRGVERMKGRLVMQAGHPEQGVPSSWMVEDVGASYGAGLYGLNYADNALELVLDIDRQTRQIKILDMPRGVDLEYESRLRLGSRHTAQAQMIPTQRFVELRGEIPVNPSRQRLKIANPSPATYLGNRILQRLSEHLEVEAELRTSYELEPPRGDLLHIYYSKPLDTLALITNHRSHNLYAEAIATLLVDSTDLGRTTRGEALSAYWRNRLALSEHSLSLVDGSGLSRLNQITPAALSLILVDLMGGLDPNDGALVETLPQVGLDGTVRRFMSASEVTAYLKSGSMRGIQCYAGYVEHEGEWYILVYMANGLRSGQEARQVLRDFLRAVFPTPPQS